MLISALLLAARTAVGVHDPPSIVPVMTLRPSSSGPVLSLEQLLDRTRTAMERTCRADTNLIDTPRLLVMLDQA
jgi:hypothetical protein